MTEANELLFVVDRTPLDVVEQQRIASQDPVVIVMEKQPKQKPMHAKRPANQLSKKQKNKPIDGNPEYINLRTQITARPFGSNPPHREKPVKGKGKKNNSSKPKNYGFQTPIGGMKAAASETEIDWRGKPNRRNNNGHGSDGNDGLRDYLENINQNRDGSDELGGEDGNFGISGSMSVFGILANKASNNWPVSFLADSNLGQGGFSDDDTSADEISISSSSDNSDYDSDGNDDDNSGAGETDIVEKQIRKISRMLNFSESGIHESMIETEDTEILAALNIKLNESDFSISSNDRELAVFLLNHTVVEDADGHRSVKTSKNDNETSDDSENDSDSSAQNLNTPFLTKSARRKQAKIERRARRDKDWNIRQAIKEEQARIAHIMTRTSPGDAVTPEIKTLLHRINKTLHVFITNEQQQHALPPMPAALRTLTKQLAINTYRLKATVSGRSAGKHVMVHRTKHSHAPNDWRDAVSRVLARPQNIVLKGNTWSGAEGRYGRGGKVKRAGGAPDDRAVARPGDVVGDGASPIGVENPGHRMMVAMGWIPGNVLGAPATGVGLASLADGGGSGFKLVEPIAATVRARRRGLGAE
ncbi:hypothetical protein HK100_000697 [Physocladia obscura]|uniref:G-patch domain-containing protein n=1 Tax=Physocladia obscura TaxID=109957 RepID=A0AAD5SYX1_9FUNG|nr:hypothetical protein HK100_000697 [Physocladia obscura]